MSKLLPYFVASLCGALLTLAFAPFSNWWLTPLSLVTLFYCYLQYRPIAFRYGLSFGLGWFGAGISWVHVSIADFGGLPLIGSLALMVLLCSYLALFPALFFNLIHYRSSTTSKLCIVVPAWFLLEWLRSWFLTGFPWLSLGYSQINGPFSGFAPIIGETGISVLLISTSFWLAVQLAEFQKSSRYTAKTIRNILSALLPFAVGAMLNGYSWVLPNGEPATISMVQGNIKQELRWVPEQDKPTMDKYLQLTAAQWDSDFIIWPEAAIPKLEPLAQDYLYSLNKKARQENTSIVTGIVNYNFETAQAFNNLIVVGNQYKIPRSPEELNTNEDKGAAHDNTTETEPGTTDADGYRYLHGNRYAKHHLLPIGEFIPLESWLRGLAPIFDLPMSSFSRGDYQQANLNANGWQLAPAICFEIAFPGQIRANIHSTTDFIVTVSNDAWFGRSHGPAQHLEIAQMRALEMGIPVIRATNNGITAFIDHQGKVAARAPQFQEAVMRHTLHSTTGITPYRYWGDLPLWVLSILCAGALFWRTRASD